MNSMADIFTGIITLCSISICYYAANYYTLKSYVSHQLIELERMNNILTNILEVELEKENENEK